jgi:hypothetical protein
MQIQQASKAWRMVGGDTEADWLIVDCSHKTGTVKVLHLVH